MCVRVGSVSEMRKWTIVDSGFVESRRFAHYRVMDLDIVFTCVFSFLFPSCIGDGFLKEMPSAEGISHSSIIINS